ncbi:H+transporting two-sector ATPase delta (OSCP) subunit [Chthoniobacter flavus Ellin428]|uniref:ATP synthase subunit delta n=1 Tax=Chthoniobacter flavus Ellin428 TaxID=497964 RepID=B4D6F2_9BACT|nr:ATP synthase F1 subunit delta [Chthoniobacter flavus]EDY18061.1 H+transporting two-sector ATPase delta (OSCP) subunit [Chthoniobacter flavus Ellin428]TCO88302.1 F-type H+-transporting ATPase subunit delta [Chthoniobacter flavus]
MKIDKDSRKLSKQLFAASFTEGKLDAKRVAAIAKEVAGSKPRNALGILKEYRRLVRLESAKHHAIVESAVDLDEAMAKELTASLKAKYGKDLRTEFKVSPELLGGLRIKVGSDVIDGSVRERLRRLESELIYA